MGYISYFPDYNGTIDFGPTEGESINQSLSFRRNFVLYSVLVRFEFFTLNPSEDIEFKIEVRKSIGLDNLLDLSVTPDASSEWVNQRSISQSSFVTFAFSGESLTSGIYFFSVISNKRIKYPITLSINEGVATTLGKFIKIKFGSGSYFQDKILSIKVNGAFTSTDSQNSFDEWNVYTQTIIKDGSS